MSEADDFPEFGWTVGFRTAAMAFGNHERGLSKPLADQDSRS